MAFKAAEVDHFDHTNVPTMRQLIKEVYQFEETNSTKLIDRDNLVKKTSLGPYIETFEEFNEDLIEFRRQLWAGQRAQEDAKMIY